MIDNADHSKSVGQCSRAALARVLVALAVCVLLAGCTVARLGYEMLPWFASWQLDRHLSLDDSQRQLVSARLEAIHAWHRQTQLPRYAKLVDTGLERLGPSVTAEDMAGWRTAMMAQWADPAERLAPDMADLALSLRPSQIDRLDKRLAEATAALRNKNLDAAPERRLEARIERWQDRLQWLLGDLNNSQVRELRRLAAQFPSDEAAWLEEREARNARLLKLLRAIERERPARDEVVRMCADFLVNFWRSDQPERAKRLEANAANGDRVSAMMISTATSAQREHLRTRLRDIEADFLRMIARAHRS